MMADETSVILCDFDGGRILKRISECSGIYRSRPTEFLVLRTSKEYAYFVYVATIREVSRDSARVIRMLIYAPVRIQHWSSI